MGKRDEFHDDIEILYDDDLDVKDLSDNKNVKNLSGKKKEKKEKKVKEVTKEKKESKGIRKKLGIACIVLILAVAGVYAGGVWYFEDHFLFHTTVDGEDFSLKMTNDVEEYLINEIDEYVLTIRESDGADETVSGKDIGLQFTSANQIQDLMDGQNRKMWFTSLWQTQELEAERGVKFDEEKFDETIAKLDCLNSKKQKKSKSAYPKFEGNTFVVVPEVFGTELDKDIFREVVSEGIYALADSVDLVEKECYIFPKYTSDSKEVVALTEKLNRYVSSKITYDFGEQKEVVDASSIGKWIKVKKKKMKASFDKEAVRAYVQSLASKYNTAYSTRKFTTARGDTVNVKGGSYGWIINKDKEYEQLMKDIKSGKEITREAVWSAKGKGLENSGVGTTYAEVDLTNQHMYFIKDGKVALESDVVTGNPNKGNATPQGMYSVTYKQKDRVLRGTKKPDGTYEYESPVKFWMPFNGGIGFHDASWQSSFGGERYKTNGSHGCVNMPTEKAAKLYDLIEAGMPVICYF